MKCLIVLTIALITFVAAAANDEDKPETLVPKSNIQDDYVAKCGISEEQLRTLYRKGLTDEKAAQEHVLCTLKMAELFSEEKGFHLDVFIAKLIAEHMDEEVAVELAAKCLYRNREKHSPAEWAYRGLECLHENKLEDLFRAAPRERKDFKI